MDYFPQPFKHAKIILIPKQNKPTTDAINYRPISLLEVPGKMLEKIINKRVRTFLEVNKTLPDSQHGFRTARSTDTAIATTVKIISKALLNRKQCCIALRDVSKAFDKVWINGLKYKLNQIKLPSILHKIRCSFLDKTSASISLNNYIGPPFQLHNGVPQGSSISLTHYIIYTYDIPAPLTDSTYIQYADDITHIITYAGKSKVMLAKITEREIKNINNYENKWKIKTNKKFTLLPITIKKLQLVIIDGNNIPYAKDAKILGLKLGTNGYSKHKRQYKQSTTSINHLGVPFIHHSPSPSPCLLYDCSCVINYQSQSWALFQSLCSIAACYIW